MAKKKSPAGKIFFVLNLFLWLAFLLVVAIVYTPLTAYMLKPLMVQEELRDADVIVVLGGGVNKGRYLSLVSAHRLIKGAQLYFEGRANRILFSGGIPASGSVAEAAVLAQEAQKLKIPAEDILQERRSGNTHEQAVEIMKMAEPRGFRSILLVTSFSHLKRALLAFENVGFKVYPAPADPCEKYMEAPIDRLWLFPRLIHEYGGLVYYKIKGWI